eukprot:4951808-Pleurochrysis_carterae.AAC.1
MLPRQRLDFATQDPTFSKLLRDLGLGGLFVMVGVNSRQRKLHRYGVVVRISLVDAIYKNGIPTEVRACLDGRRRAWVCGPATALAARVGRWRREYDPDGEVKALGWGLERFVDDMGSGRSTDGAAADGLWDGKKEKSSSSAAYSMDGGVGPNVEADRKRSLFEWNEVP